MIVNELVTKFKFDTGNGFKKFDSRLKHTKRDVNRTTKSMKGMFKRFGSSIKKSLRHNLHLRGVKSAQRNLNGLRSSAMSLKSALIGIGAGYLGFQALSNVMSRTLKVGSQNEQLFAGLSTLRGPQQATRDMKDLQTMAAKTPFQVGELTDSFMRLNAAGFNVDIKSMQKLGDLAANTTGKSIGDLTETMLSAARGQGAMVDNFNGMAGKAKNGGLEITSLDAKTGKLTTTMVKAGDKASLLGAYLNAAGESDTLGSMARKSKTLEGRLSTLSDNVDMALLQLFKGLEPAIKQAVSALTDMAVKFKPLARDFGVFLKMNLPSYFKNISKAFKSLIPAVKIAAVAIGLLLLNLTGLKILALSSSMSNLILELRSVGVSGFLAGKGLTAASVGAAALQIAVGAIAIAIAALAYDVYTFAQTGDSALLRFTEKWPLLHELVYGFMLAMESLGRGFMDLNGVMQWWSDNAIGVFGLMGDGFMSLMTYITTTASAYLQIAVAKFNQFMLQVGIVWSNIKAGAADLGISILQSIMSPFNAIGQWLANLPQLAVNAFNGLANAAINAASKIPVIGGGISAMIGRNKGGYIPGSGNTDTVPTMLTPGEFVINKPMVQDILSGSPRGLMKLQAQMRAPQMAMAGSSAISPQSVSTYSVPASSMTSNATNITINAPMTQTNTINSMGNSPAEMGAKLGNAAADKFSKGLSNAARQVPQRIGRV